MAEFVKKVKRDKAWMTDFNVERNYSSPFRVEELMEDWALTHSAVVQVMLSLCTYRVLQKVATEVLEIHATPIAFI